MGAIDERRYEDALSRLERKRVVNEAELAAQMEMLKNVQFVERLPIDPPPRTTEDRRALVPEPRYFQIRIEWLSSEQQAEYSTAFGQSPDLSLIQKYAFVRLLAASFVHASSLPTPSTRLCSPARPQ